MYVFCNKLWDRNMGKSYGLNSEEWKGLFYELQCKRARKQLKPYKIKLKKTPCVKLRKQNGSRLWHLAK